MAREPITPIYHPLRPDGRQSETALAVQRGTGRLMRAHGFAVLAEYTLASGRRADLIGLKPDGTVWIVEIKSSREDFMVLRFPQNWIKRCCRKTQASSWLINMALKSCVRHLPIHWWRHGAKPLHCHLHDMQRKSCTASGTLLRRAFRQDALQSAAMHVQTPCGFGHISIAQFKHPLNVLPAHPVR
jgi:hypothetical protein